MEEWRKIKGFSRYSVSSHGRVRNDMTDRIMVQTSNQFGVVFVGLMRDGVQMHRSVPLLVATAFLHRPFGAMDTPINLDGDRRNNNLENLVWRPRWFAVMYNQQVREPYRHHITSPIRDIATKAVYPDSYTCALTFGLLEKDLVMSILNRTYVWPTYQQFEILQQ